MYVEKLPSSLDKGARCKSSVLEVAWAQQISSRCTCVQSPWAQEAVWERSGWSLPETQYEVRGERAFALQRWSQDCLLTGVGLVGITLVAVQRDGITTYSSFPSGKKGSCRGSGPRQWVPALSLSLDTAVIGESRYDWVLGFYGGLIRLCYFETPAPSCTDPSSWPLL